MAHPEMQRISFTYPTVASMWVFTLHSLFLYSDPPLPCEPPSYWLGLFSKQTISRINTPMFLKPSHECGRNVRQEAWTGEHFLNRHGVDICLLSETVINPGQAFRLGNYVYHRTGRPTAEAAQPSWSAVV